MLLFHILCCCFVPYAFFLCLMLLSCALPSPLVLPSPVGCFRGGELQAVAQGHLSCLPKLTFFVTTSKVKMPRNRTPTAVPAMAPKVSCSGALLMLNFPVTNPNGRNIALTSVKSLMSSAHRCSLSLSIISRWLRTSSESLVIDSERPAIFVWFHSRSRYDD